jgi:hypothetical protein
MIRAQQLPAQKTERDSLIKEVELKLVAQCKSARLYQEITQDWALKKGVAQFVIKM